MTLRVIKVKLKMELQSTIRIPKGKRVLTKIVNNELLVYFTDSDNVKKPVKYLG